MFLLQASFYTHTEDPTSVPLPWQRGRAVETGDATASPLYLLARFFKTLSLLLPFPPCSHEHFTLLWLRGIRKVSWFSWMTDGINLNEVNILVRGKYPIFLSDWIKFIVNLVSGKHCSTSSLSFPYLMQLNLKLQHWVTHTASVLLVIHQHSGNAKMNPRKFVKLRPDWLYATCLIMDLNRLLQEYQEKQ